AAVRLGHLLVKADAEVRVARLPLLFGEDKTGPDDLLVALGADALLEALADGLALDELAWERRNKAERRITATTHAHYRSSTPPPQQECHLCKPALNDFKVSSSLSKSRPTSIS
ncbi:hypothetical protein MUO79_05395, partial [Candidatus Bathyarchaeota archaeon]|nr:hypothetical protein [Candidatus Bathyarchaeota archaeon]